MEFHLGPGARVSFTKPELAGHVPPETLSLLNRIWEVYKPFTSVQLSNMTHTADSPWTQARSQHQGVIDNEAIRLYFLGQMNAAK